MNIESIRTYCLSLPLVTEDMPFDDTTVVFRVLGKIFLLLDLDRPEWVSMKCDADFAIELRDAPHRDRRRLPHEQEILEPAESLRLS